MAGEPSHFEIGVPDARRARAYYGKLLGWKFRSTAGDDAWIETPVTRGGLHGHDDERWIQVYFSVPDIEAAVRLVRELGGEAGEPGAGRGIGTLRLVSGRPGRPVRSPPAIATCAVTSACSDAPVAIAAE